MHKIVASYLLYPSKRPYSHYRHTAFFNCWNYAYSIFKVLFVFLRCFSTALVAYQTNS